MAVAALVPTRTAAADEEAAKQGKKDEDKAWYERLEIGGYTQVRYNRLVASNPAYENDEADEAIGPPARFSLRRARLVVKGEMSILRLYLQPELAGAVEGNENVVAMRDAYGDIALVPDKQLRARVGLSKVPFAFENMQSSQDRAPFDRSDGVNSAMPGERDLGAYLMWAPPEVRERFEKLSSQRWKGSGDYGVAALGIFNGQGLNEAEQNANKHVVARVSYPLTFGTQTIELGAAGYSGLFVPQRSNGEDYAPAVRDVRAVASFVLYPAPLGVQAEYTVGVGPEKVGDAIEQRPLDGGYATVLVKAGSLFPYVRAQRYDGGWKSQPGVPRRVVHEVEAGLEWQVAKVLTLKMAYQEGVRTLDGERQQGRLLRAQAQLNY